MGIGPYLAIDKFIPFSDLGFVTTFNNRDYVPIKNKKNGIIKPGYTAFIETSTPLSTN